MAVIELRYGKNEQLRRIAQEIIVDQMQEIAAMKLAIGEPAADPRRRRRNPVRPRGKRSPSFGHPDEHVRRNETLGAEHEVLEILSLRRTILATVAVAGRAGPGALASTRCPDQPS